MASNIRVYQSASSHRKKLEGGLRRRGSFLKKTEPDKPLITIITAVLNGMSHLEQTIQSVLNQGYDNIEYIIVDGGSTDGTLDIIRRYDDKIAYWLSEPDKGIYDAMNKGIVLSTGEIVGLINSDDYYEKGAIEQVVDAYRKYGVKNGTIIYGNYYILDEIINVKTELLSDLKFWKGMSICHQAMFVTRDIYQTDSPYDTKLKYAADYAFLVNAIRTNVNFINTEKFLVTFRNVGATYNNVVSSYRESLSILRQHSGLFSKNFMMFFFFRFVKSIFVTVARTSLNKFVSKDALARAKMFYNRLSRKTSYKV